MKKPSLNHVFRLVWNDALGVYVPVAEHASARRKRNASSAAALSAALLLSGPALAADLPTGGNVVAGSGSISQNGTSMTINQQTGKMAIDWQGFSIGKGNSVTFNQPGRDAVALNRVLGPDVSVIQGALNANGQVFLVNPNGVVFTPTAQVNVGGIVASTLNISTQDFMAGNYRFEGASSNAIVNQGNITAAAGGSIALIAAKITNTGNLTADKGNVLMGAGSRVKLDLGGPVKIEVEQGAIDALIEQGGAIRADGGVVYLTAKAAGDLASTVINHTGITQAKTLATGENGKIVLLGDMVNDRVAVGGTLDASAPNGGKGGFIETSAAKISVAAGAVISTKAVSGQHGNWLIDPTDFTVSAGAGSASDSGIGADTLAASLNGSNVELRTVDAGNDAGNINVNASVKWSASTKLTLSAHGDVVINAPITATGAAAGLEINVGGFQQRGWSSGGSYAANAPVTLSGAQSTFKSNGQEYTMLRSVQDFQSLNWLGYGFYALAQDLDLTGMIFSGALVGNLQGTLAGLGHNVDNLTINAGNGHSAGLIGTIAESAVVRDLTLRNANVTGGSDLGTLASANLGTIRNVSASGSVTGTSTLGGLVASNYSIITGSNARTSVTSTTKSYFLGGLAGINGANATLDNVYATGNVSGASTDMGGLVGANLGVIRNAYATGDVTAAADSSGTGIGGLAGTARDNSIISNVYASGRVVASGHTGGVVGLNNGVNITLQNAQWDPASTGQANAVGGGGDATGALSVANPYSYTSYGNLGTWSQVPGAENVWVAKDGAGKAQWIMLDGFTRPFLASEYSLAVSNDHQLQLMAYNLGANYNIVRDIDAKATSVVGSGMWNVNGFTPIGVYSEFTGSLNGNGHTIANLNVGNYGAFAGLFGIIGAAATVQNVGLTNGTVNSFTQAGGLAGINYGTINNTYFNGTVRADGLGGGIGGLVGMNFGTISNSYSSGVVSNNMPLVGQMGGLVGYNAGTINKSYTTTTVSNQFFMPGVGALVGYNLGTVNDSFAASTDAAGLPVSPMPLQLVASNGGVVSASSGMKTYEQLGQLSTFTDAGWNIDTIGGTDSIWRMYEGQGGPLLRSFLKQVTVSLADKVYDGQVSGGAGYISSNPNATLGGSINYITNSKNAGTYRQEDGSLTVTGGLYSNQQGYDVIYADNLSLTVQKKGVAALLSGQDKVYDGTTNATLTAAAITGYVAGDELGGSGSGTFSDKNAGAGKSITINTYGLSGADADNYFIATLIPGTASASILARQITGELTATDKVYDGTTSANYSGWLSGPLGSDNVMVASNFADKNVGQQKQVTYSLAGADAGNYVLAGNLALGSSASITPKTLTGIITVADKVYDGTTVATIDGHMTGGMVAGDNVWISGTGTFSDKNVGVSKLVSVSSALSGEDAQNYVISANETATASITPKTLTGAITAAGKTYDGTRDATVSGELSGVVQGDAVTMSSSGLFADRNAGVGKRVDVVAELFGNDAGNYVLSHNETTSATIARKMLTGAITASGKTYDGLLTASTSGTLDGKIAGDNVTLSTSGAFGDKNVGVGKLVSVNGVLVGADADNYSVSANTSSIATITARQLTGALGALDKTYDGNQLAAVTGAGSLNVVQGDALTVSGSFSDKNVGTAKSVAYAISGADAGNYALGDGVVQLKASITQRDLSGAITASGKIYDGSLAASTNGSLDGVLLGDVVSLSTTGSFLDKNVGNGKTVNVSGSLLGLDAGNYRLSTNATTTANITPKAISGALTAASKVYDGSRDAATTGTLTGVVNGDNVGVSGTGQFSDKNVGNGKAVAVAGLLTGADAGNYLLTTNTTTQANITPKALTGAITAAGKTYDGTTAAETSGALNGVVEGDLVALSTLGAFFDKNAGVGKQVNVSGALVGGDAGNYTVTSNSTTLATITPKTLTGALSAAGKVYDGNTVATVGGADSINGIVEGDSLGVAGTFADKNAGERKAVAFSLTGADAGNYVLNAANARATISQRVLAIIGTTVSDKTYDGSTAAQANAGSLTNLVEGETLGVGATAQFDSANAGKRNANVSYALSDTGSGLAANYVLADTQHQADIGRRAITVVADDKTKRAGDADPALTWRVAQGNLIGNDTLAGALNRALGETAGNYAISANGLSNSNYLVAAQDGTLVISNAVQPDSRRESALSSAQWLQAAVGNANSTPPNLTGDLSYVPVSSNSQNQNQNGNAQPAPNAGQGARAMQGPAQVLVIDGGIRLPEGLVQGSL